MRALVRATYAQRIEHGAAFDFDDGWQCRVQVLGEHLARVLFVREGRFREPRTWMVAPGSADVPWEGRPRQDLRGFAPPHVEVGESAAGFVLATGELRVAIRLDPFGIDWSGGAAPFARDRPTQAYQWSERESRLRHYLARPVAERYFGLGDKTGALDLQGRRLRTLALDALGYDAQRSDPLYKHWPFVLARTPAGACYGLFYDTLAPVTFDLGSEHDNYHGLYRYAEIEGGDLDYYLCAGPGVRDVVRQFTELTGRMAFGPRWSLGYANTAMSLADAPDAQAQLARFAEDLITHDIPCSAFHFGSGYTSIDKRRYVFTWNRHKFPAPRAAIERFRRQGIRTVVNLKPCLLDDHPAYAEVAVRDGFVRDAATGQPCIGQFWDGQGAHIDFTHPAGIAWWQGELRRQVLDYGIDAGWNDNNEYEIWDDDGSSAGFGTPIDIERSRPLHPLLMTRATAEAQAAHRPDERAFTVTRAGPPGIQRYAQTWSGDNTTSWHTLRWNIRMGLTMSLSGMFNTGHDVGGFAGPVPDPEMLVRWTQSGAFSPRFIMNSWKDGGETNTPWLHPAALHAVRDAIRLRYRLMPYLYTLFHAATQGEPIVRPLFYDFETDPECYADTDDFMCGASLLVASVVEPGQRRRKVYLPRGPRAWHDFWTGGTYAPGGTVTVDAPLSRIPLFVPAGAMIPLTDTLDFSRLHDEPSRRLDVFPPESVSRQSSTLYEDDGLSLRYRQGGCADVVFTMATTRTTIEIAARRSGDYAAGSRTIRVVLPASERRRLRLRGDGVELVAGRRRG